MTSGFYGGDISGRQIKFIRIILARPRRDPAPRRAALLALPGLSRSASDLAALGILLARVYRNGICALVVPARACAHAAAGAAGAGAACRLLAGPRIDLRRAPDALRLHGATHVLPEPRPTCSDAPSGPDLDRARLCRADREARYARYAAPARREPTRRRCPRHPAAAGHRRAALRRAVLFLARPRGAFSRHARRTGVCGDELEHGAGRC